MVERGTECDVSTRNYTKDRTLFLLFCVENTVWLSIRQDLDLALVIARCRGRLRLRLRLRLRARLQTKTKTKIRD